MFLGYEKLNLQGNMSGALKTGQINPFHNLFQTFYSAKPNFAKL